jgi:hypothetical protein
VQTDRTVRNSKLDRNVVEKEAEEALQYRDITLAIQVECKSRSDTINIRGHWNILTVTQTVP